jgi:signal transduction histidine kinase
LTVSSSMPIEPVTSPTVSVIRSRKRRFDLNGASNEAIVLARSAIAKNGILVQTRVTEGLGSRAGDRVQLQQVFLNLIPNAVEAMDTLNAGSRELLISAQDRRRASPGSPSSSIRIPRGSSGFTYGRSRPQRHHLP